MSVHIHSGARLFLSDANRLWQGKENVENDVAKDKVTEVYGMKSSDSMPNHHTPMMDQAVKRYDFARDTSYQHSPSCGSQTNPLVSASCFRLFGSQVLPRLACNDHVARRSRVIF
jgi:hypothetical protein